MRSKKLLALAEHALADVKARDIKVLDVRQLTTIADYMIVASGTSDRHVRSIADRVVQASKAGGHRPFGVEGERDGEWVLVDLPDVMVHVMLPRVREFYGLESLWDRGNNELKLTAPSDEPSPSKSRVPATRKAAARKPAASKPRRPRRSPPRS